MTTAKSTKTLKLLSAYMIDDDNLSKINISMGTENRKIPSKLLDGIDYFMRLKRRGNMTQILKIVPLEEIIVKKGTTIDTGKGISILDSKLHHPKLIDGFNSIIGPNTFGEYRKKNNFNNEYKIIYDHATAIQQLKTNIDKLKNATNIKEGININVMFLYEDGSINIEKL